MNFSISLVEKESVPFLSEHTIDFPASLQRGQDEDIHTEMDTSSRQKKRRKRYLDASIRCVTILFATWGFISLCLQLAQTFPQAPHSSRSSNFSAVQADVYRPETLPPGLNICDCGNSIPEALSLNCVYDSLAAAWLPPHCRDGVLTSRFERAGPGPNGSWAYFADPNGTRELSLVEVSELGVGRRSFWGTQKWHLAHCLFYWQKYTRMRVTGVVMERRFDLLAHVQHCTRLVMMVERMDDAILLEVDVRMNATLDEELREVRLDSPQT